MKSNKFVKEIYKPKFIELIHQMISLSHQTNNPKSFEIYVDGIRMIDKTDDLEVFEQSTKFVNGDTKIFEIRVYNDNSDFFDTYQFTFISDEQPKQNPVSGVAIPSLQKSEEEIKQEVLRGLELEKLKNENLELKADLEYATELAQDLEKQLERVIEGKKQKFADRVDLAISGLAKSSFLKPFFGESSNLSGVQQEEQVNSDASFKRKSNNQETEHQQVESELSEEEQFHLETLKSLRANLSQVDYTNIMHLLDLLNNNPKSIPFALKQTTNYVNQKNQK